MAAAKEMLERIGDGAEAIVYREEELAIKDRVSKRYRLGEIDTRLRKARTRQEASILRKLGSIGFPSPRVMKADDQGMLLHMEFIRGPQLKEVLDAAKGRKGIAEELGKLIALLHRNDIIHGDLTTSNMILGEQRVSLIDFGLGFFSTKTEDKAVDLHLLRRALDSKHPRIAEGFFSAALASYRKEMGGAADDILTRLEQVEKRGRYQRAGKKKAGSGSAAEEPLPPATSLLEKAAIFLLWIIFLDHHRHIDLLPG